MNPVSIGEYHGLRVGSALLGIVAGCIIIGVSRECDADAVGGIFLGAGGLGEYVYETLHFLACFTPAVNHCDTQCIFLFSALCQTGSLGNNSQICHITMLLNILHIS